MNKSREKTDSQLHISGSQIGSDIRINDSNVILENCTLLESKVPTRHVLIDAINSTVIMKSLHIEMFQGGCFLQVTKGKAHIEDSEFINCTSGAGVLINIVDASLLTIDNCTYALNDGRLVNLGSSSIGTLSNSIFESNTVTRSSAFIYHLARAHKGSTLIANNSYFFNYTVQAGATIGVDNSVGVIDNSSFIRNTAPAFGVVSVRFSKMLMVSRSNFLHNNCRGVIANDSKTIFISASFFDGNSVAGQVGQAAGVGGAILAIYVSLNLDKSVFLNNSASHSDTYPAVSGGAVFLHYGSSKITDCKFESNTATVGGALRAEFVLLDIDSCVFVNNEGIGATGFGGAIAVTTSNSSANDTLFITNSTFQGNKATMSGGAISSDIHTIIRASTFTANNGGSGGAISCGDAFITDSHFDTNRANNRGGALSALYGPHIISHTTFTFNVALRGGQYVPTTRPTFPVIIAHFMATRQVSGESAAHSQTST